MPGGGSKIAPVEASATEYSLTQAAQRESSGYRRIGLGALLGLSALVLLLLPQQLSLEVAYRTADLMAAEPEPVAGRDGVIDFKKRPQDEVAEMAYVILIRHGEKGSKGEADYNGLSPTGMKRAEYLARCMSSPLSSLALPAGPPKYLLASHTKPDKSHRAIDTAMPLAQRLGLKVHDQIHTKDYTSFLAAVHSFLKHHRDTMVAVWHHGEIPGLIKELLGPMGWDHQWPKQWPMACSEESWKEPADLKGESSCYDCLWRVTLTRNKGATHQWRVVSLTSTLEGFRGDPAGECFEGLQPVVES